MKIGIDARCLNWSDNTIGPYQRGLVHTLLNHKTTDTVTIFVPEGVDFLHHSSQIDVVPTDIRPGSTAEQIEFGHLLDQYQFDVVHFLHFYHPISYNGTQYYTCMDSVPIKNGAAVHSSASTLESMLFRHAIKKATAIITPLLSIKRELGEHYRRAADRIWVIPLGSDIDKAVVSSDNEELQGTRKAYIVGYISNNASLAQIFEAFSTLRASNRSLQLVLCGQPKPLLAHAQALASHFHFHSSVIIKDEVTDAQQNELFQHAKAVVILSSDTGYNFLVTRAMLGRVPVLCSATPSLIETASGGALYCSPDDPVQLADTLKKVVTDPHLRRVLIEQGTQRLAELSWTYCVDHLFERYHALFVQHKQ